MSPRRRLILKLHLDTDSLYYETLGHGEPAILLMHGGLGLDHTVLRPWLDPLAESHRLIYYDHLANGRSEFRGQPESLSHDVWVDTADELRRHLAYDRVLLFGHSYGAMLALEYALKYPDHLDGLILSNVAPVLDYPDVIMANAERKAPDEATLQAVIDVLSGPVADDAAAATAFRRIHPLYFHEYEPRYDSVLDDVQFRSVAMNRSSFGCLPDYDVEHRLGEITVPTLIVSGADDWITPPRQGGERVAAGIPNADHVVFESSGHWPFVEETDRFLSVIREWMIG